jgi:hypothetical protein
MQNQKANYLGSQYAMERGMQDAANQAWSGRESTYDASGMSADAQRAAARMAANASMYNTDSQRYIAQQQIGAQNAMNQWAKQTGMWGIADDYANMGRQGQGLGALGVYGQGMSQTLPWQQGFGVNTQQGPKVSSMGGFLQGALGGALGGAGMGSKGGSSNAGFYNPSHSAYGTGELLRRGG